MIVQPHSPRIPEMVAKLKQTWKTQLASRNGSIPQSPSARFDKVFENVAIMLLENDIDPVRYVSVAIDIAANTSHVFPTHLNSDAVKQAFTQDAAGGETEANAVRRYHYTAEVARADALLGAGKSPAALVEGAYDFSALTLWVVFTSFKQDASRFFDDARAELRRNKEARDVFGDILRGLE